MTGFTTKSWLGKIPEESRGIMDLTTVLPHAFKDIGVQVEYLKDANFEYLKDSIDVTNTLCFVKLWDINDKVYAQHAKELLDRLEWIDENKIYLIEDHHDGRPAFESLNWCCHPSAIKLVNVYKKGRVLRNVYKPKKYLEFDPSPYCYNRANFLSGETPKLERAWVYASLSAPMQTSEKLTLPILTFTDLKEYELTAKIRAHGLVYMNEYPHTNPLWWRIRYLMAAFNGAAVYASSRDQRALYGFYIPPNVMEENPQEVAELQKRVFLKDIWSKQDFCKKLETILV